MPSQQKFAPAVSLRYNLFMSRLSYWLRQEFKDTLMGLPELASDDTINRLLQHPALKQYNIYVSPCESSTECLNQLLETLYRAGGTEALSELLRVLAEQTPFVEQKKRIRQLQRRMLLQPKPMPRWVSVGCLVVILPLVFFFVTNQFDLNDNATATPSDAFIYQIKLLDRMTEAPVSNATVEIYFGDDLAPSTFVTSDQGLAFLYIPIEYDGQIVERIIFADGYERKREIFNVRADIPTQTVLLAPLP